MTSHSALMQTLGVSRYSGEIIRQPIYRVYIRQLLCGTADYSPTSLIWVQPLREILGR